MPSKDKKRNSEKRKEKSRDAARCRRSKESEVFYQLAQNLPLPSSVTAQLDKASVMRLTISFLKIYQIREEKKWHDDEKDMGGDEEIQKRLQKMYPKALEGFVLILSKEGDIIYISENTGKILGIPQIELMGQSLFDFTHPCDHDEIQDLMIARSPKSKPSTMEERTMFIRFKCTLTSKGKSVNLKSASYKVIKVSGRLVLGDSKDDEDNALYPYLMSVAEPIPHPSNIEVPLDSSAFLTKHSMDMKFTYCDERIKDLIGYDPELLKGKSLYDYHHALDSEVVDKAYKDLFAKGQTMTGQYRFLAKNGGYIWMVTQGTVIHNARTHKPQWVVCVHYAISNVQEKELLLSDVQLSEPEASTTPLQMEFNTEKCFAPKTKDMTSHYYVPPEMKNALTIVHNDPEDLSYLAPTAGDGCISLGFQDLEEVTSDFGGLKPDLIFKKEPVRMSPDRMEVVSRNTSPMTMSPRSVPPSPPSAVDMMDKFFTDMDTEQTGKLDSIQETTEIDMSMRAPYISMSGEEDACLAPPSNDTLFTLKDDFNPGLFGKTESVFMDKNIFEFPPCPPQPSMRDLMGSSTVMASIEQPTKTMVMQFKRPLDKSSLEKGPPVAKLFRKDTDMFLKGDLSSKDSVLLNLLLTGEDRNHGYKVNLDFQETAECKSKRILFSELTRQDYEVNAPTSTRRLLQGEDLLKALDGGYSTSMET